MAFEAHTRTKEFLSSTSVRALFRRRRRAKIAFVIKLYYVLFPCFDYLPSYRTRETFRLNDEEMILSPHFFPRQQSRGSSAADEKARRPSERIKPHFVNLLGDAMESKNAFDVLGGFIDLGFRSIHCA